MPTHASIFTGKFPSAHGANYDPDGPLNLGDGIGKQYGGYRARPIAENEVTLAQVLSDHGYATGGVIAGPWLLGRFRLGKGFQHYDDSGVTALNGRPADDVTRAAFEFVDAHQDEPFFLFLNYYDAHSPWNEPPELDAKGKPTGPPKPLHDIRPVIPPGLDPAKIDGVTTARIFYDSEIHFMDREIGRLLDHLKLRGLYEDTWIFVLADHGDLIGDPVLGESGLWGHGDSLTEPEIHIPFFVKEPGPLARTGEDPTFVQQVDILPTILARLGIPLPPNVQGLPIGGSHPIVAELKKLPMMNQRASANGTKDWRHLGDWRVLVDGKKKYGWSSNGTPFLVDLEGDPAERTNIVDQHPEIAQRMEQALETYMRHLPKPGETGEVEPLTAEEQEMLQKLGYTGPASEEDEKKKDGQGGK